MDATECNWPVSQPQAAAIIRNHGLDPLDFAVDRLAATVKPDGDYDWLKGEVVTAAMVYMWLGY
jgi:hypothetical protein